MPLAIHVRPMEPVVVRRGGAEGQVWVQVVGGLPALAWQLPPPIRVEAESGGKYRLSDGRGEGLVVWIYRRSGWSTHIRVAFDGPREWDVVRGRIAG